MILNDYPQFINFADGLHLGQEDLLNINKNKSRAIAKVKEQIGSKILGISTHNKAEILEANQFNELNYIGLGAYRPTKTKVGAKVYGTELLEIAKYSNQKVALIGGVKLNDDLSNTPQISYKVIGSNLIDYFLYNS